MSDKEGTLRMQSNRRWAITRPGRAPYELTSGDVFRVEVKGRLQVTRMEYRNFGDDPIRHRQPRGQSGEYYSVDGFELRSGIRAAIGAED